MIPLDPRPRTEPSRTLLRLAAMVAACGSAAPAAAGDIDLLLGHPAERNAIVLVAGDTPSDPVVAAGSVADRTPDPLRGTEQIDPATTGPDAARSIESLLPPRTDTLADWFAPLEPLHDCGEPRLLPPCVPPPPCHPALPPQPYDLVGVRGGPTCGPIYRGPCAPRTGTHDDGPHPRVHRIHDRLFDWFYAPRTPVLP